MKCFVYYVSCKFYNHSSHFFPSTKEFFVMVEMFKYGELKLLSNALIYVYHNTGPFEILTSLYAGAILCRQGLRTTLRRTIEIAITGVAVGKSISHILSEIITTAPLFMAGRQVHYRCCFTNFSATVTPKVNTFSKPTTLVMQY